MLAAGTALHRLQQMKATLLAIGDKSAAPRLGCTTTFTSHLQKEEEGLHGQPLATMHAVPKHACNHRALSLAAPVLCVFLLLSFFFCLLTSQIH
jgi:hypothetical protein